MTFIRDTKKLLQALSAFAKYSLSEEVGTPCISSFSADSYVNIKGIISTYKIELYNNSPTPFRGTLLVDIYSKDGQAHIGYYGLNFPLEKHEYRSLLFHFDWNQKGSFETDGIFLEPSVCWAGDAVSDDKYRVRAILSDTEKRKFGNLFLIQEVRESP